MIKIKTYNEIEVYKAYLEVKGIKQNSVVDLCQRLNIPRATLYSIVDRIEKGDEKQLQRCLHQSKYDCLWKFRYSRRFYVIDELHGDDYSKQITSLVKEMKSDGFGIREIGRRICKDPSTVNFHIAKKD